MSVIKLKRQDHILEITLDRPPANAIDAQASRELDAAFDRFQTDDDLRVAIVTGAGERFFTAGWDLKAVARGDETEDNFGAHGFMGLPERFDLNKPVIAAINGMAAGGGFEIALACDVVIAAAHAEFTLPEVHRGFIPEAGGVIRLPRRLPYAIAMELLLTGRRATAEELARHGLVNRVVAGDRVLAAARDVARQIIDAGPLAVRAVKEVIQATEGLPVPEAFAKMRSGLADFMRMRASEDRIEGPRAFAEKRKPRWRGR